MQSKYNIIESYLSWQPDKIQKILKEKGNSIDIPMLNAYVIRWCEQYHKEEADEIDTLYTLQSLLGLL